MYIRNLGDQLVKTFPRRSISNQTSFEDHCELDIGPITIIQLDLELHRVPEFRYRPWIRRYQIVTMEGESKKSNTKKNNDNGGGGGGENKKSTRAGARKRNARRGKRGGGGGGGGGQSGQKKPAVPPPPQTKITFRRIGNVDKHGTVKDIMEMIRSMLSSIESTTFSIELEEATVRRLIKDDELYQAALAEEAKKADSRESKVSVEDQGKDGSDDADKSADAIPEDQTADQSQATKGDTNANKAGEDANNLDVIVAPKKPSILPTITARPLFVLPPKKTRRRGERAGTAYVVFTGPKIDPQKVVEKEPPIKEATTTKSTNTSDSSASKGAQEPQTDDPASGKPDSTEAVDSKSPEEDGEVPLATAVSADESTADPSGNDPAPGAKTTTAAPKPTPKPSKSANADYSRAVAKGRLLLKQAVDALVQLADEDAKAQQIYAGCSVEEAMSGKTWRHQNHRPDRREGTIESTSDFKNWLQSLTKQEEDLKARPKPTPGGGGLAMTAGVDGTENGQQLSAIVMHLRAKRQEAKRKKAKKKKEKNDKAKGKKKKEGSKQRSGGGGGSNKEANTKGKEGGKKKRKKRNPRKKDKAANTPAGGGGAAPTLLKPPSATAKASAAPG